MSVSDNDFINFINSGRTKMSGCHEPLSVSTINIMNEIEELRERVNLLQTSCSELNSSFVILERTFSEHTWIRDKKPYKCPLCDGVGTPFTAPTSCKGCDDDGIVWG